MRKKYQELESWGWQLEERGTAKENIQAFNWYVCEGIAIDSLRSV